MQEKIQTTIERVEKENYKDFLFMCPTDNAIKAYFIFLILHKCGIIKNNNFLTIKDIKEVDTLTENIEHAYEKNKNALGKTPLADFLKNLEHHESEMIFDVIHECPSYKILQ